MIELLLFTQSASRHRVLTAFIHALTNATDLEEQEDPLPNGINTWTIYYGPVGDEDRLFGKLNGMCNVFSYTQSTRKEGLMLHFDAFMRWRIGSQPTTIRIESDMHETIASGIGHLEMIKPNQLLDTKDK